MSAIAVFTSNKPLTSTGAVSASQAGVLNTDYSVITFTPQGIDNNGVAKWRNLAAASITMAETATFSSSVQGEKVFAREVVTVPVSVTYNGVTTVKNVVAELRVTSHIAHAAIDRRAAGQLAVQAYLTTFQADALTGASPF